MRLYYAHAMCLYGAVKESAEIAAIAPGLPWCEIVNPSTLRRNADESDSMQYFLRMIDCCDGLVTAGVGLEANHALAIRLPVYELEGGVCLPGNPARRGRRR